MPDWSTAIFIPSAQFPYTCPENGYIKVHGIGYYGKGTLVAINNVMISDVVMGGDDGSCDITMVPVSKGDIVRICIDYMSGNSVQYYEGNIERRFGVFLLNVKNNFYFA